jgi:hypothetical protein
VNVVDEVIRDARTLLGAMTPVGAMTAFAVTPPVNPPTSWDSSAGTAAGAAGANLDGQLTQLQLAHHSVTAAITEADEITRNAHSQLTAVENAWASDQAATDPGAETTEGHAGLLQSARQHINDVTAVVQAAAEQFQTVATRIAAAGAALPH